MAKDAQSNYKTFVVTLPVTCQMAIVATTSDVAVAAAADIVANVMKSMPDLKAFLHFGSGGVAEVIGGATDKPSSKKAKAEPDSDEESEEEEDEDEEEEEDEKPAKAKAKASSKKASKDEDEESEEEEDEDEGSEEEEDEKPAKKAAGKMKIKVRK